MAKVGIIMGSDSDLPIMQEAIDILKHFDVLTEVDIVSAHRTPEKLYSYATQAHTRGIKVIIAGAGGAAHLPGMVAAMTHLPVIGVPIKTSTLSGVDSLYSILQMPRGVVVATVAINNAYNAGLLAIQILALENSILSEQLQSYRANQTTSVLEKAKKLEKIGYKAYLKE